MIKKRQDDDDDGSVDLDLPQKNKKNYLWPDVIPQRLRLAKRQDDSSDGPDETIAEDS